MNNNIQKTIISLLLIVLLIIVGKFIFLKDTVTHQTSECGQNELYDTKTDSCIVSPYIPKQVDQQVNPTEKKTSVKEKIQDISLYQPIPKLAFDKKDNCTREILHINFQTAKRLELFNAGKYNITVYATPNTETYTKETFKNATPKCAEIGTIKPLTIVDNYQLWWSPTSCGYEIGEPFENQTENSRECTKINDVINTFRTNNI